MWVVKFGEIGWMSSDTEIAKKVVGCRNCTYYHIRLIVAIRSW